MARNPYQDPYFGDTFGEDYFDLPYEGVEEYTPPPQQAPAPSPQPAPTMSPYGNTDFERQFWGLFPDLTPGTGQTKFTPEMLQSKAGDLSNLGFSLVGPDKVSYGGETIDVIEDVGGKGIPVFQRRGYNADGSVYTGPPPGGGGGGGGGGDYGSLSSSSSSSSRPFGDMGSFMKTLEGLFPGGLFNQDIVNRRTELAREDLNRQGKSRTATNRAALANRGLIGSGPEQTAQNRVEGDIADQYSNAVSGIYANESEAADRRMMQALQIYAGLTAEDAQNIIDQFRANTERDLGLGNLALGNTRAANEYNLGLGQYGLNRDRLSYEMDQSDIDNYYDYLRMLSQLGGQSQEGYY